MGDEVQAIKAGLLEVADIVVVNKGDRPGAQRTAAQLRAMLVPARRRATRRRTRRGPRPKRPEVLVTTAATGEGVPELLAALDRHRAAGARRRDPRRPPGARRRRRSGRCSSSGSGSGSDAGRRPRARTRRSRPSPGTSSIRTRRPTACWPPLERRRSGDERRAGLRRRGRAHGPRHRAGPRRHRQAGDALRARPRPGRGGPRRIAGNLERAVAKGKITAEDRDAILARLTPTDDLGAAADADLVVEAVFEDLDVKTRLWADARRASRRPAPSSPRTLVHRHRPRWPPRSGEARRARFVGMHFFSPVPVMPLIELIRGAATDDATEAAVRALAARARQAGDRVGRPAGVHRQPDPDAVPRRGDARVRGGAGHGRGHRHGGEGRAQPPDGPARARRLHRPRRVPRDHAGARTRASGSRSSRRRACSRSWWRPGTWARRPAAGSTPTRADQPPVTGSTTARTVASIPARSKGLATIGTPERAMKATISGLSGSPESSTNRWRRSGRAAAMRS